MDMTQRQSRLIELNIRRVFETADIEALSQSAYHLITQHMGFIAHYDLSGFKGSYDDLRHFAARLQTSEYYYDDPAWDRNLDWADELDRRYTADPTSRGGGQPPTVTATIRAIVRVAREYMPRIEEVFTAREKAQDMETIRRLSAKWQEGT